MKMRRFTRAQIVGSLKESEAGATAVDLCRRHGIGGCLVCHSVFSW